MTTEIVVGFVVGFLKLVISIILAVFAIFAAINVVRKLFKEKDIFEELKEGNVAMGILVAGFIVSVSLIIQSGVSALVNAGFDLIEILAGLVSLFLGIVLAICMQYIGLKIYDKLTKGIEEIREIEEKNVAIAILLAAILIALAYVVQPGIAGITTQISSLTP